MILALALSFLFSAFLFYIYGKTAKEKSALFYDLKVAKEKSKDLIIDLSTVKKEKERLEERNIYLEGRLNAFIQENEMLGSKIIELENLYSLEKERVNTLKFKLIEIEESMPLIKGKAAKTKKGISENISREKHAHPDMPIKQAAAIAYSTARGGKPRNGAKKK